MRCERCYGTGQIERPDVALCQGGCGLVPVSELLPDPNDPPGICPKCKAQTCNSRCCVTAPCPDCNGSGVAHCCDGICEQPERDGADPS